MILRGGKAPNYDAASVAAACKDLEAAKLPPHADGRLQPRQQQQAAPEADRRGAATSPAQIAGGSAQRVRRDGREPPEGRRAEVHARARTTPPTLEYGKSITDACLGWDDSTQVLDVLSQAVKQRRG